MVSTESERFLRDDHGRIIRYLRVSVTDRCDLRCRYCVPTSGIPLSRRDDRLDSGEVLRVLRIAVQQGVRKIRFTGGEPLLRQDLSEIVGGVSQLRPRLEVGLTTNGSKLEACAQELSRAGLRRVNVGLPSLERERYRKVTRGGELTAVLRGVRAARELGLSVKVNVVALPDLSQAEMLAFADWARREPIEVRFIEFMPLCGTEWVPDAFRPVKAVKEAISEHFAIEPVFSPGVAQIYRIEGGRGRVGFIAALSRPFCGGCDRLRLTSTGALIPCLFSYTGIGLRQYLRTGADDGQLFEAFRAAAALKPLGHGLEKGCARGRRSEGAFMRQIGG